jgi:hypothetical protein
MRKQWVILMLFTFTCHQLLFAGHADSSFFNRFHLGLGCFTGVQRLDFKYHYETFKIETDANYGFDAGLSGKLGFDLSKKYSLFTDYRWRRSNTSVPYARYITEFSSGVQQVGLNLQRIFYTHKHTQLLKLHAGITYVWANNSVSYSIDPRYLPPYPIWSTVETKYVTENFTHQYTTAVLGISKSIPVWKRLQLEFFTELDFGLEKLDWHDIKYIGYFYQDDEPTYQPLILRMGFSIVY